MIDINNAIFHDTSLKRKAYYSPQMHFINKAYLHIIHSYVCFLIWLMIDLKKYQFTVHFVLDDRQTDK